MTAHSGTAVELARRAGRKFKQGAPFPVGQTEERHRALAAQGYIVSKGKTGVTVFSWLYEGL
jgi:hypothetical protein